jgi:long-chain acyl-CoA synthetase
VAVVPTETPNGPEPVAVLAMRGSNGQAAAAIEHANTRLAEYQRLRRWVVWPEPDLPRTSTGKIRRKVVAADLARLQAAAAGNGHHANGNHNGNGGSNGNGKANGSKSLPTDWLLTLVAQISGEVPLGAGDELLLTEDLHLDSLGRVQLAAAMEERLGIATKDGLLDHVQTLGELRGLLGRSTEHEQAAAEQARGSQPALYVPLNEGDHGSARTEAEHGTATVLNPAKAARDPSAGLGLGHGLEALGSEGRDFEVRETRTDAAPPREKYVYPHWPWWAPVRWLRIAFVEAVMRPLVWLLSNPTVVRPAAVNGREPMLIVANHVTSVDAPLLEYALPPEIRHRIAVAMSGDMLEDYRHFRDADRLKVEAKFFLPGPLFYFLVTALFNVFPLPKQRDFQRSFSHAGEALDHGMHVMLFPEGIRSAEGTLARFRPGIGLLVKQSSAPVLPMALRGLGELKRAGRGWFRSGTVEVRVGEPMRFSPTESEAAITEQLHAAVEMLLRD